MFEDFIAGACFWNNRRDQHGAHGACVYVSLCAHPYLCVCVCVCKNYVKIQNGVKADAMRHVTLFQVHPFIGKNCLPLTLTDVLSHYSRQMVCAKLARALYLFLFSSF